MNLLWLYILVASLLAYPVNLSHALVLLPLASSFSPSIGPKTLKVPAAGAKLTNFLVAPMFGEVFRSAAADESSTEELKRLQEHPNLGELIKSAFASTADESTSEELKRLQEQHDAFSKELFDLKILKKENLVHIPLIDRTIDHSLDVPFDLFRVRGFKLHATGAFLERHVAGKRFRSDFAKSNTKIPTDDRLELRITKMYTDEEGRKRVRLRSKKPVKTVILTRSSKKQEIWRVNDDYGYIQVEGLIKDSTILVDHLHSVVRNSKSLKQPLE